MGHAQVQRGVNVIQGRGYTTDGSSSVCFAGRLKCFRSVLDLGTVSIVSFFGSTRSMVLLGFKKLGDRGSLRQIQFLLFLLLLLLTTDGIK